MVFSDKKIDKYDVPIKIDKKLVKHVKVTKLLSAMPVRTYSGKNM